MLFSNRIPNNFFVTSGVGESDISLHAGSFHQALKNAKIEEFNIITYSSILPKNAKRISKPTNLEFGSVLETIMSVIHLERDQWGIAGLTFGWLFEKETGDKKGGIVCEMTSTKSIDDLYVNLENGMTELYGPYRNQYDLKGIDVLTKQFTPRKNYGTALVSICFVDYIVNILKEI